MSRKINISVLGVGTELTSGQILNRNAVWISRKMKDLGAETSMHLVVPDEKNLILDALKTCSVHSDLIFVTGGLGPTSDDFTRDIVAQWAGLELQWDEGSWQHLNERLKPRYIPVKDIQKQQCYFPKGARILINQMGTANGFSIPFQGREVFVLPGPPREIEAIWTDCLAPILAEKCQGVERQITKSWDTIGFGESQIAELVEQALKGCSYERAYRVHIPYVEFKLSYWSSQEIEAPQWCERVDLALAPMTLLRDGEDIAQTICEKLKFFPKISILDQTNGSFFLKRVFEFSKHILGKNEVHLSNTKAAEESLASPDTLCLELYCQGFEKAIAQWRFMGVQESQTITTPGFNSILQQERAHQYFAETAMVFFAKKLIHAQITSSHSP